SRLSDLAAVHVTTTASGAGVAPISTATAQVTSVAMKGSLMTAKAKAGLVTLAAVGVFGAGYHTTHPGELQQLVHGTTTMTERKSATQPKTKAVQIPTMGPGEEVYQGTLTMTD